MRVISQNGTMDVPYETSSLFVYFMQCVDPERAVIYCKNSCFKEDEIIAEYSTEEKALKAVELLREKYRKLKVMKVIANGTAEYMEKSLSTDEMIEQYNAYCDMNTFQFPQDDEIEV